LIFLSLQDSDIFLRLPFLLLCSPPQPDHAISLWNEHLGIVDHSHVLVMGRAIPVELAIRLRFQLGEVHKALVLKFVALEILD